ncbi:MAG TPA: hypothetical protein VM165_22125 [Planctomycetaceae bacterium]|nr:hypothetical protein [Planctomycetaceae bacterium]
MWVREVIRAAGEGIRVLDPFAGSGTVLIEAAGLGVEGIGLESHPFVSRIAKVKIRQDVDPDGYQAYIQSLVKRAPRLAASVENYPSLIRKCYPDEQLGELDQLRSAWSETRDSPYYDHGWLTLSAILRQCSPVGTANWQYVLPKKTKAKVADPLLAFKARGRQIHADMQARSRSAHPGVLLQEDAREMNGVPDNWATLIITSPPYPNNFDYADATRLEMSFFGDVTGWSGLQDGVRKHLVRSCTQHVSPIVPQTKQMIATAEVAAIRDELGVVCDRLEAERADHGGKKNYHTMIAAYFVDMARVWQSLRRVTAKGGRICFVIGDSAPYGIYVPVDKWMGALALAAGFHSFSFEKTRDRNIKWKNRKHRVPLQEGRLWVEG